jgi:hypothetical protein
LGLKDEEFLQQLSDFQVIKEACFMEAVLGAFGTYYYY